MANYSCHVSGSTSNNPAAIFFLGGGGVAIANSHTPCRCFLIHPVEDAFELILHRVTS